MNTIIIEKDKTALTTFIPYANKRGDKIGSPFMLCTHMQKYVAYTDGTKTWEKTTHEKYFATNQSKFFPAVPADKISENSNTSLIDEYLESYAVHVAPIFACWYTRFTYAKHPTNRNMKNYYECCAYVRNAEYSQADYELYLDREHKNLFVDPNTKKYVQDKISKADAIRKSKNALQYVKKHTFKMGKALNGKRYRIECMPFETLENTSKGQHVFSLDQCYHEMGSDGLDIIQDIATTLVYLMRCGYIWTWRDMKHALYACKSILNAKYENVYRISDKKNIALESVQDHLSEPYAKYEKRIESESLLKSARRFLVQNLPKKCNKSNVLFVYDNCLLAGMTLTDAGEYLKVSKMACSKYMSYINAILAMDDMKKLVYGE